MPKTRSFGPEFITQSVDDLWTLNISYGKFSWDMLFVALQGFRGSGFQGSAQPPAKKTTGQIEKETNILLENGIGFLNKCNLNWRAERHH
jgi:hypothetical protein